MQIVGAGASRDVRTSSEAAGDEEDSSLSGADTNGSVGIMTLRGDPVSGDAIDAVNDYRASGRATGAVTAHVVTLPSVMDIE